MFKYNHDCPFEAYITNFNSYNNGKHIGKWHKFPSTDEQFKATLSEIGIFDQNNEWFITDYDIYVDNIKDKVGSFSSFEELNTLAKEIIKIGT